MHAPAPKAPSTATIVCVVAVSTGLFLAAERCRDGSSFTSWGSATDPVPTFTRRLRFLARQRPTTIQPYGSTGGTLESGSCSNTGTGSTTVTGAIGVASDCGGD